MSPTASPDVLELVQAHAQPKVKVAVTDIDGVLRGKYLAKEKFLSAAKGGMGFCNVVLGWDSSDVCYDNAAYTGWHTGYPDVQVRLDLARSREEVRSIDGPTKGKSLFMLRLMCRLIF